MDCLNQCEIQQIAMRDQQQIQNLSEARFDEAQEQEILTKNRWKYSLAAMLYKNKVIYQQNYCSNICQLLTPIICILFTLTVKFISSKTATGTVADFSFIQPMHLPQINHLIPAKGFKCSERYYYSLSNSTQSTKEDMTLAHNLYSYVLKAECSQTNKLQPQFIACDNSNLEAVKDLDQANTKIFKRGVDIYDNIPDGLIQMNEITSSKLNLTLSVNDWRIPEYHTNNGITKLDLHSQDGLLVTYLRVTEGMMSLIQKITRSYLLMLNKTEVIAGSFMYMPFDGQDKSFINKISNVVGSSLYPLALSLLFPIILFNIVSEKEQKLIQIMKMNGLLLKYYWISFFFFNVLISLLSCTLLFVLGKFVFDVTFFLDTEWTIIWMLFVGWSIAQVSFATFIQIFINSSKAATIIGYLLSIFSIMIGSTICTIVYPFPEQLPVYLNFYPPFALTRGIYLIGFACANNSSCFKNLYNISREMYTVYFCLYSWIFMFIFSIYLHNMIQQEFGTVQRPKWLNFILKNSNEEKKVDFYDEGNFENDVLTQEIGQDEKMADESEVLLELQDQQQIDKKKAINRIDLSVINEAKRTTIMHNRERPLIIKELAKSYQNGHKALLPNTFSLQEKEIFGLLGPNGAGKTTLISVLTGLYGASSGLGWIDGVEIGAQETNLKIGVCPQFDLLWQSLTISEHMFFYGLLKGIEYSQITDTINKLLLDVDLLKDRDLQSRELSGGMRRRLSLAIALIGNPKVVFLDEPSSGLDPTHRRQLWDILLKYKSKTTILLTTHLMQQAQALCDRIAIIDKGRLRCIGTQRQLKTRFGMGYRITINFKQWCGQREKVLQVLKESQCNIVSNLSSRMIIKVQKEKMLECVKKLQKFTSLNWLLSEPSLYDVFMYFIN